MTEEDGAAGEDRSKRFRDSVAHYEAMADRANRQIQQQRAIDEAMLEAQQDTVSLLRDLISEIKTLRRVIEDRNV